MRIFYAQSIWYFLLLCTADEITRRFTHWIAMKRTDSLQKLLNCRLNRNKYPWNANQETWRGSNLNGFQFEWNAIWMGSNFLVREKLGFLFYPENGLYFSFLCSPETPFVSRAENWLGFVPTYGKIHIGWIFWLSFWTLSGGITFFRVFKWTKLN